MGGSGYRVGSTGRLSWAATTRGSVRRSNSCHSGYATTPQWRLCPDGGHDPIPRLGRVRTPAARVARPPRMTQTRRSTRQDRAARPARRADRSARRAASRADAAREACTDCGSTRRCAGASPRPRPSRASGAPRRARPSTVPEFPVDVVRELMSGARDWPDDLDPGLRTLKGAVAATAESERVVSLVRTAPLQALARLHVAAASPVVTRRRAGAPADRRRGLHRARRPRSGPARRRRRRPAGLPLGPHRRRGGQQPRSGRGRRRRSCTPRSPRSAPSSTATASSPGPWSAPSSRPSGSTRPASRSPRPATSANGGPAYLGALTAYAQGGAAGVGLWLAQAGEAMVRGAAEGERISDAVRAGRLS